MKKKYLIFIFILFLRIIFIAQDSPLKIYLFDKVTGEAISKKEVTVTINDTLVKQLITNEDGETKAIWLYGIHYKIKISAKGYEDATFKRVGINHARGRHFGVRLKPKKNIN